MKKRIPIFSVLVFLYALISAYQQVSNFSRTIAIFVRTGQMLPPAMFRSVLMGLLPALLMIALGVLALLVEKKPELAKVAGVVGLVWSGFGAYRLLTGVIGMVTTGSSEVIFLIYNLLSRVPEIITLVFWLILSINMLRGKYNPKKAPTLLQVVAIASLFIVFHALAVVAQSGGGGNVIGVLINSILKCVPLVCAYFAGVLLHVTFTQPTETPVLTQNHVKSLVVYTVVIAIILAVSFACSNMGGRGGRGDGVNTCRNCGRNVPLVVGFGFCSICYEGFNDFLDAD